MPERGSPQATGQQATRRPAARPPAVRPARPAFTGRALVLAAVVIGILVLLAAPLHRYFASRADVSNAAQQLHDDQSQLAILKHQEALWSDPGYVQEQARVQLQYAMPGDTVYVVVRPGQRGSSTGQTGAGAPNASTQPTGSTWATRLWGSVQAADAAP